MVSKVELEHTKEMFELFSNFLKVPLGVLSVYKKYENNVISSKHAHFSAICNIYFYNFRH